MSFEEYCVYIQKITHAKRYENIAIHCSAVEQGIQGGEFLPVRIDEMAPFKGDTTAVHFIPESVALIRIESLARYQE